MSGQRLRLVGENVTHGTPTPQSLRADRQLAAQVLTVDELHAADRIARLQVDAATDLGEAIGNCDRERCVRALRRLVAVGAMSQSLANSLEERP